MIREAWSIRTLQSEIKCASCVETRVKDFLPARSYKCAGVYPITNKYILSTDKIKKGLICSL